MSQTPQSITRDFDRIARLPDDPWDHNRMYLGMLLRELPARVGDALEIGCGSGELSARLAARAERVLALDLSPEMLAAARARCAGLANVDFVCADALEHPLAPASFDAIASVATLHHLPLAAMLARLRDALAPGGVLVVLDVVSELTAFELARSALAAPLNLLGRLATTGRLRPPPEVRAAWDAHCATDRCPAVAEVRRIAAELLPGARIRQHLFWRYSLVWRKLAR
ncbi:MAG TPA: class I SAM-dependent methyltransferase [Myxococcota bacterium]|nr:class I SAM-dependent methyltransferase [Myxococcota bacterium]